LKDPISEKQFALIQWVFATIVPGFLIFAAVVIVGPTDGRMHSFIALVLAYWLYNTFRNFFTSWRRRS
jgi:hypothetical protein